MVKMKSIVAKMAAANVVVPMLASKNSQGLEENEDKKRKSPDMGSKGQTKVSLTKGQLKKLFDKLDLSRIKDWSNEDQKEMQKLIKDFGFLFTLIWVQPLL